MQEIIDPATPLVSYKGFDARMQCRGMQFAVGETYTHDGEVEVCASGFHACAYPLDVFGYYPPADSRYALVEQFGAVARESSDSKIASRSLTVHGELALADLIAEAHAYTLRGCTAADTRHATGDRSASSATGDRSASSATGDISASSATGYSSASSATGVRSASSATGVRSASSATGDSSASSATGVRSASSATGDGSASSATGDRSASLTTGAYSASEITPAPAGRALHAVAIGAGHQNRARAPAGSAICLVHRNGRGEILHIRAAKIGADGLAADTWYELDATGAFRALTDEAQP